MTPAALMPTRWPSAPRASGRGKVGSCAAPRTDLIVGFHHRDLLPADGDVLDIRAWGRGTEGVIGLDAAQRGGGGRTVSRIVELDIDLHRWRGWGGGESRRAAWPRRERATERLLTGMSIAGRYVPLDQGIGARTRHTAVQLEAGWSASHSSAQESHVCLLEGQFLLSLSGGALACLTGAMSTRDEVSAIQGVHAWETEAWAELEAHAKALGDTHLRDLLRVSAMG